MMPFDNPDQKAEALNNFRPLDVHCWSDYSEVNAAVNALFNDLRHAPEFPAGNKSLRKKHIKVVILDLYATWISDPTRYIAYSRSKNDYKGRSRYNKLHISFLTVPVVDALHSRGYVEHHKGFHNAELEVGRLSRMKANDKLIELIQTEYAIPEEAIQRCPRVECLILRKKINGRKVDIE